MKFTFADSILEEVYYNAESSLGFGPAVDKGFRKVMGKIVAANSEFVLHQLGGLHYHKLKGDRNHQNALDITEKWRLIVEREEEKGETSLIIVAVENYH